MEKQIYLSYISALESSLKSKNPLIQVLLGPRQVGKTTTMLKLIEEKFPKNSLYVSADEVFHSDAEWLNEQWNIAKQEKKILFVDEIQKIPNWAEIVKKFYDESLREKQPVACVLLGSSSLEIQKGLSESLTGRFQLRRAHHWNFCESQEAYGLSFENYLKFGGYPGSYGFIQNEKEWSQYVRQSIISTVVEKDILQFSQVKNPALFKQAFELLMSYPAQEISYTKLLGQLQNKGNVELVKHYISLYEGAFLMKALDKFSGKALKRKASSPKILPLAPCLYYSTRLEDYDQESKGHVFEMLVGMQLVRTEEELFYWREGHDEVDFVLKRGQKIWAIEVKSGRKRKRSGLLAFQEKYPSAKSCIIHPENYFEFEKDPLAFLERF